MGNSRDGNREKWNEQHHWRSPEKLLFFMTFKNGVEGGWSLYKKRFFLKRSMPNGTNQKDCTVEIIVSAWCKAAWFSQRCCWTRNLAWGCVNDDIFYCGLVRFNDKKSGAVMTSGSPCSQFYTLYEGGDNVNRI